MCFIQSLFTSTSDKCSARISWELCGEHDDPPKPVPKGSRPKRCLINVPSRANVGEDQRGTAVSALGVSWIGTCILVRSLDSSSWVEEVESYSSTTGAFTMQAHAYRADRQLSPKAPSASPPGSTNALLTNKQSRMSFRSILGIWNTKSSVLEYGAISSGCV